MGQLWLLLLIASQAALWQSSVDATFDIGLRWLRGDNSFFYSIVNTTTTPETEPPLPTLEDVNTTVTVGALNGRRANVSASTTPATPTPVDTTEFVDPTTTTRVPPQDSRSEPASSPATTGTTATMLPSTTPLLIENATRVSLDDLALEIAKVQDPVLHLMQNEDGSPSYVVVSGRLGSTTAATTVATTAATTPAPTFGTTMPSVRNTTSVSYETLLDYLRPWIFRRLFQAPTTTSAAAVEPTTQSPTTAPGPSTPPAWTSAPAATSTTDSRTLDLAITPATTSDTGTHLTEDPTTTTQFPAEFRETESGEDYALTEATAFNESSNATVAGTAMPSTVQPASTADTATPVATDAAPTPRTASTSGDVTETRSAFPAQTTSSENVTARHTVTAAGPPATTPRMPSPTNGTTPASVTTLQPPVGDLREDTILPTTTAESPTSLPTVNQTSEGYNLSTLPFDTVEEQPAYRFYYDPSEVTM